MHHALLDLNQPFSAALTCEPVAMSHGRNSWVKVWILDKIQNATVGLAKLRLVSCFTIFDWIDIPRKRQTKRCSSMNESGGNRCCKDVWDLHIASFYQPNDSGSLTAFSDIHGHILQIQELGTAMGICGSKQLWSTLMSKQNLYWYLIYLLWSQKRLEWNQTRGSHA